MKLYTINTGLFKLDGGAMFGVVPKSIWNKINPADENNMCSWALRCLLIGYQGRLLLIDTGIGDKQDAKFFAHYYQHGEDNLQKSLAAHGYHPDDITDVILTHLHFDHCGGSIVRQGDQLAPAFRNAVYWSERQHWEWATHPNDREKASFLKENILPIQESGRLRFVDYDAPIADPANRELQMPALQTAHFPSDDSNYKDIPITFRIANGHTRSMLLPQIKYKDRTIVFMADLLPSQGHIPLPYVMAYDMFPLTTLGEKKSFLQEALDNDYILFFEHDPVYECCTLQQTARGIRPRDYFRLEEI